MLELRDVVKTYRMGEETVQALDHVSLHVRKGEYVAIVGPSGSGKSTMMHILGCLDTPTSGEMWLDGQPVSGLTPGELCLVRRQKIGFVFQGFQLLARLSALENVAFPLMLRGVDIKRRSAAAQAALERVGLGARLFHLPSQLSGGQKQRVAIARALVTEPGLLLADEPTGSLDEESRGEVLDILDGLHREGHTLVLITHDGMVARRARTRYRVSRGCLSREQ